MLNTGQFSGPAERALRARCVPNPNVADGVRQIVDDELTNWRQGDCVVGNQWFLHRADPSAPLTEESAAVAEQGGDAVEAEVPGFIVASQTCDIVRSCEERPYIEVCPLIRIDDDELLDQIKESRRPQYAFLSGVADMHLVADLDRVMTVEKSVVANSPVAPSRYGQNEYCATCRDFW